MRFDSTTGRAAGKRRSPRKAVAARVNASRPRPARRKPETETNPFLSLRATDPTRVRRNRLSRLLARHADRGRP